MRWAKGLSRETHNLALHVLHIPFVLPIINKG